MYGYCPLGSGSRGNSVLVAGRGTKILIDAGLSGRAICQRLGELNVDIGEIDAVVVTHEHTDHIQGLKALTGKYSIPVITNAETAKGICKALGEVPRFKIFTTGESFQLGEMELHPFTIQHDAADPVAFTVRLDEFKLGFCTDLGFATTLVQAELQGCDYLYLESNHDPSMVHASSRPMIYKQRVLGRSGHLSNEGCGQLLTQVYHSGLRHVHLAHLSSECNHPTRALEVAGAALQKIGASVDLAVAPQDRIGTPIHFSSHATLSV